MTNSVKLLETSRHVTSQAINQPIYSFANELNGNDSGPVKLLMKLLQFLLNEPDDELRSGPVDLCAYLRRLLKKVEVEEGLAIDNEKSLMGKFGGYKDQLIDGKTGYQWLQEKIKLTQQKHALRARLVACDDEARELEQRGEKESAAASDGERASARASLAEQPLSQMYWQANPVIKTMPVWVTALIPEVVLGIINEVVGGALSECVSGISSTWNTVKSFGSNTLAEARAASAEISNLMGELKNVTSMEAAKPLLTSIGFQMCLYLGIPMSVIPADLSKLSKKPGSQSAPSRSALIKAEQNRKTKQD